MDSVFERLLMEQILEKSDAYGEQYEREELLQKGTITLTRGNP